MKLRAKLFLATFCLIIVMLAITYFLPSLVVERNVSEISEEIRASIISSIDNELQQQKEWFEKEMEQRQDEIQLLLLTIKGEPTLYKKLIFSSDITKKERWLAGALLLSSSPEVSIIQLYSPQMGQANVLFYDRADLYNGVIVSKAEGEYSIILPEKKHVYNGYPLESQSNVYVMERPILPLQEQESYVEKYSPWVEKKNMGLAATWDLKNRLLNILAPLHADGIEINGKILFPDGIFLLDQSQNGIAFLTDEAFQNTPLLNIEETFDPSIPLEKQKALLVFGSKGHFYLTYTMFLENTFISAGISLSPIASEFAKATNKIIILNSGQHWLGFDNQGHELNQEEIYQFVQNSKFGEREGEVSINQEPFFFSRLVLSNTNNLTLYSLYPLTTGTSILHTLSTLVDTLSARILWMILLIGILVTLLSIGIIYILTRSVIKPLEIFVRSTKQIAEGKFDQVRLPNLGKRQDEIALLSKAFEQMIRDMKERENIRSVLNKVISKEIANEFLNSEVHLGGEDRIVTMLFSDIRSFTSLTENLSPQKVIKMLNLYMTKMAEIIESKQGIIDKFVGDEIMAIFGAPVFHSDHSLQAISAGYEMLHTIKEFNQQLKLIGEPIFEIGVGVHTGPVVAGNMGAENRMNYTVLGKNVNLAARLCQAAKPGQLIVSEYTYKAPNVEAKFSAQSLEPLMLKGFREPVAIYEITGLKAH